MAIRRPPQRCETRRVFGEAPGEVGGHQVCSLNGLAFTCSFGVGFLCLSAQQES